MATGKRKKYTDKFKAGAILMLEAEGYPQYSYALENVAKRLNVPGRTLSRWFKGESGAPDDKIVEEQKTGLVELFEGELRKVFMSMNVVRDDASYRDLATAAGIFADKLQLLNNKPTSINQTDVSVSELVDLDDNELTSILEAVHEFREATGNQDGDHDGA